MGAAGRAWLFLLGVPGGFVTQVSTVFGGWILLGVWVGGTIMVKIMQALGQLDVGYKTNSPASGHLVLCN